MRTDRLRVPLGGSFRDGGRRHASNPYPGGNEREGQVPSIPWRTPEPKDRTLDGGGNGSDGCHLRAIPSEGHTI